MIRESLGCIDINLTSKCNCECKYCFAEKGKQQLSISQIEEMFKDGVELKTKQVVLSGGEPLLYDDLEKVLELSEEYGYFTILLTNGIVINKDIITIIKKHISVVRMTLDSPIEIDFDKIKGEGAYKKFINTLILFKENDIRINLSVPISGRETEEFIEEVVCFCKKYGVFSVRFSPIIPVSSNAVYVKLIKAILEYTIKDGKNLYYPDFMKIDSVNDFIGELKLLRCPGESISLNVNPDGSVTKCAFNKFSFGNINSERLKDIWYKNYNMEAKCNIVEYQILDDIKDYLVTVWDYPEVRRAVSSWYYEIHGKRKLCIRNFPFWTIYLKNKFI